MRRSLVLLLTLILAAASAGAAAASCNPGRTAASGNWQDEWEAGPDFGGGTACYNGSRANIGVAGPNVQHAWDSVWTGIINASNSDPQQQVFGQVGYIVDPGPTVSPFEETQWYSVNDGLWHDVETPLVYSINVGDDPEFKVTYSTNNMHYFINDVNVYTRDLTRPYGGCDAVQSSEVHNKGDQAAGEPIAHESLTASSSLRNGSGNVWITGNWSAPFVKHSVDWLKHQVQGTDDVDFWDACTS